MVTTFQEDQLPSDDAQELCDEACVDDAVLTSLDDDCVMSESGGLLQLDKC